MRIVRINCDWQMHKIFLFDSSIRSTRPAEAIHLLFRVCLLEIMFEWLAVNVEWLLLNIVLSLLVSTSTSQNVCLQSVIFGGSVLTMPQHSIDFQLEIAAVCEPHTVTLRS